MSRVTQVQLTKDQRDILLRGLRYVRRSITLDIVDRSDEVVSEQSDKLEELDALVEQLDGYTSQNVTADV